MPEEAKRWFAFISENRCHHDQRLDPSSADGSNKQPSGEENKKEKRGCPIQGVLLDSCKQERPALTLISRKGPQDPQQQQNSLRSYQESRGQGAPRRPFGQQAEGVPARGLLRRPGWIGSHQRPGPVGAQRGPTGCSWRVQHHDLFAEGCRGQKETRRRPVGL